MGAGNHGGFGNTYGSVAAGDAVYKSEPGDFFPNIANRKDKDKNGNLIADETIAEAIHDYYLHGYSCSKSSYEIVSIIKSKL